MINQLCVIQLFFNSGLYAVNYFKLNFNDISSPSSCQEFLAHGFEPFSIPVLSFKFDNQQELTKKLEEPSKYEGTIYNPIETFVCSWTSSRVGEGGVLNKENLG